MRHIFRCTHCNTERVWGNTVAKEGHGSPQDPPYREQKSPMLLCAADCTKTGEHLLHTFVRYDLSLLGEVQPSTSTSTP